MRLIAFGGDARVRGTLSAAENAGWETLHITGDYAGDIPSADAVLLPWARSFRENELVVQQGEKSMTRESVLAKIPPCTAALVGGDVRDEELPQVGRVIRPDRDEAFLRFNARLTAEGAMMTLLRVRKRALLASTAVITGYGRIGQEMTARLCAMGMFVIVCVRSEEQMRRAHAAGAHPVPLSQIAAACRQADVVVNTVPAHVLDEEALAAMRRDTPIIELASPPYGLDMQRAVQLGLQVCVESGLPGRYAPMDAGRALFDALMRGMTAVEEKGEKADE